MPTEKEYLKYLISKNFWVYGFKKEREINKLKKEKYLLNKERKKILENKKKVNDEIKKLLTDIKNLSGEELIKSLKEKLK